MSDSWQDRQRRHLFATWTAQRGARRFEIDKAQGARFHVPGHGWVWDLESQVYNVSVGHGHPHVRRRMIDQINDITAAAPNVLLPIRGQVSEMLCRVSGMDRVFLATGGSEAAENAVKMACLATGRRKVLTRRNSYHGATLAMLELAGDPRRAPFAASLHEPLHIDDPYPWQLDATGTSPWVHSLLAVLEREGPQTIAAILLEGLTGTNGMQLPPPDFWPTVRQLCDRHGIVLIDDEIFAGFGRTGKWFAHEHWGVRPDMIVIGKGLTSGYAPLAGVLVGAEVAKRFEDEVLWCGLTSYAHPVSCAAAVGTMEVLENERLVDNAAIVGAALGEALEGFQAALRPVRSARGTGMMRLLELDRPTGGLVPLLFERGIHAATRGSYLFVCPPLCLTADELREVVERLGEGLALFCGR